HDQAVRQGRPGEWTLEDAEAARQQANTLGRPWGAHGPTPAERWAKRRTVTTQERRSFAVSVACLEDEAASASASAPAVAEPIPAPAVTPAPVLPVAGATAGVVDHTEPRPEATATATESPACEEETNSNRHAAGLSETEEEGAEA